MSHFFNIILILAPPNVVLLPGISAGGLMELTTSFCYFGNSVRRQKIHLKLDLHTKSGNSKSQIISFSLILYNIVANTQTLKCILCINSFGFFLVGSPVEGLFSLVYVHTHFFFLSPLNAK